MNRLRIVIEEAGPGVYEAKYLGHDSGKAQEALHEPTRNKRALFIYPSPGQYNRRLFEGGPLGTAAPIATIRVEGGDEGPAEDVPVEVADFEPAAVAEDAPERDEAAELVGGATEAPADVDAAPKAGSKSRKTKKSN